MKFRAGDRAMFLDLENRDVTALFHAASMGDLVMHLNARDENGQIKPFTGTILKVITEPDGSTTYDFAPDGWKTPASGWPQGFQAAEKYLHKLEDPNLTIPGTVTDRMGNKVQ